MSVGNVKLRSFQLADVYDCKSRCKVTNGCRFYEWNHESKMCSLIDSDLKELFFNTNTLIGAGACSLSLELWKKHLVPTHQTTSTTITTTSTETTTAMLQLSEVNTAFGRLGLCQQQPFIFKRIYKDKYLANITLRLSISDLKCIKLI